MRHLLALFFITLSTACAACDFKQQELVGTYLYASGDSKFEAFELNDERQFSSWLHNRLASSGTWRVEDCHLIIAETGLNERKVKVIAITEERLSVEFNGLEKGADFTRVQ